jgi:S-DNA-T family DNA segregation ATPase FtsK/SpoIIIE
MARTASPPAVGDRLAAAGRRFASPAVRAAMRRRVAELLGLVLVLFGLVLGVALASYDPADPSFSTATAQLTRNLAGPIGAHTADILLQGFGYAAFLPVACLMTWAWRLASHKGLSPFALRLACLLGTLPLLAATMILLPLPTDAPAASGPGGAAGPVVAEAALGLLRDLLGPVGGGIGHIALAGLTLTLGFVALGLSFGEWRRAGAAAGSVAGTAASGAARVTAAGARQLGERVPPSAVARAVAWPFATLGRAVGGAVRRRRERETPLSELLRNADALAEEAPPPKVPRRREPSLDEAVARRHGPPRRRPSPMHARAACRCRTAPGASRPCRC